MSIKKLKISLAVEIGSNLLAKWLFRHKMAENLLKMGRLAR
jgi:hypothetical protein